MQTDREFSTLTQLPQFPGPSRVTRYNASEDPDTGTAETVALMEHAAVEDSISPQVWSATQQATSGARSHRQACEGIYRWLSSHVRFRSDDPVLKSLLGLDNELDLLIRPARLLTMNQPAEDCDGFTMLACAMMLCAGIPCEIVTIKADPDEPDRFSHVYCQAILQSGPLCMDCSQAAQHNYPIGWEAPDYFERKSWGILQPQQEKGMHGYMGLGACADDDPTCTSDFGLPGVGGQPGIDLGSPGGGSSSPGAGINWTQIATALGADAARITQLATLPQGYTLNAMGQPVYAATAGIGSINPLYLLLGGGVLLLAVLGSRK